VGLKRVFGELHARLPRLSAEPLVGLKQDKEHEEVFELALSAEPLVGLKRSKTTLPWT